MPRDGDTMAKTKLLPSFEKQVVQVVVSDREYFEIDQRARDEGKTVSAYCAEKILGRPSELKPRGRPKKAG